MPWFIRMAFNAKDNQVFRADISLITILMMNMKVFFLRPQ